MDNILFFIFQLKFSDFSFPFLAFFAMLSFNHCRSKEMLRSLMASAVFIFHYSDANLENMILIYVHKFSGNYGTFSTALRAKPGPSLIRIDFRIKFAISLRIM